MGYIVYKHTTPNNKIYIGITKQNITRRWQNGLGYRGQLFFKAILKYGWDNIKHEILYTNLSKEDAEKKEIELIKKYKSNQKEYGYNIDNGGNCIGKVNMETREKIKKAMLGMQHTEETKEKHRKAQLKLWQNKEYREKRKNNYNLNRLEKGYTVYRSGKPVICVETNQVFDRIKDASEYFGICDECIRKCCNGVRKTAGGYHWRFYKGVML